jgi:hypothetical protein
MSARQVVSSGSEVYKQSCSVACDQARATSLILVLKESIPSMGKGISVSEKATNI